MTGFNNTRSQDVRFNKNGYEIRADILALAKSHVENDYQASLTQWKYNESRDPTSSVPAPEFPGVSRILEVAAQLYSFVNSGANR